MIDIEIINEAWLFAAKAHKSQKYPIDDLPYLTHIGSVTLEVFTIAYELNNPTLAITCAILHDTIEDTEITYNNIKDKFGEDVAKGVNALSKNKNLATKKERMQDSLNRILQKPKEIWAIKMADRVANLGKPPKTWTKEKRENYLEEAKLILDTLKDANATIAKRLKQKIEDYKQYIKE